MKRLEYLPEIRIAAEKIKDAFRFYSTVIRYRLMHGEISSEKYRQENHGAVMRRSSELENIGATSK